MRMRMRCGYDGGIYNKSIDIACMFVILNDYVPFMLPRIMRCVHKQYLDSDFSFSCRRLNHILIIIVVVMIYIRSHFDRIYWSLLILFDLSQKSIVSRGKNVWKINFSSLRGMPQFKLHTHKKSPHLIKSLSIRKKTRQMDAAVKPSTLKLWNGPHRVNAALKNGKIMLAARGKIHFALWITEKTNLPLINWACVCVWGGVGSNFCFSKTFAD